MQSKEFFQKWWVFEETEMPVILMKSLHVMYMCELSAQTPINMYKYCLLKYVNEMF